MTNIQKRLAATRNINLSDRPSKKEFKPWHYPRKQWVRTEQWGKFFRELLTKNTLPESYRNACYLTLPGEDFLDVKELASICKSVGWSELKYVGFNDSDADSKEYQELIVSRHEIEQQGLVSPNSKTIHSNLTKLHSKQSNAWQDVNLNGPYHAINFDLCGSLLPDREWLRASSMVRAIANLVDYQCSHPYPWLFFLTTRFDSENIHEEAKKRIAERISSNAEDQRFLDELNKIISTKGASPREDFLKDSLCENGPLFGLGIAKWLLGICNAQWKITVLDSCFYTVGKQSQSTPNMISLAFKFEKLMGPIEDPTGLVKKTSSQLPSEIDLAIPLASESCHIIDLDELLSLDADYYEKLLKNSAQSLENARYDVSGYEKWVKDNCRTYQKILKLKESA